VVGFTLFLRHWRRLRIRNGESWLEALDRRFFREQSDARRLLYDVVEEVHVARSFEQEAPQVTTRSESSEDRDLLIAIAASLAILLERPVTAEALPRSDIFEECPQCGSCYVLFRPFRAITAFLKIS